MGHSDSKLLPPPQISAASAQRGIPPVIQVSYKKSWTKILALLGEPDSDPIYSVSLPGGWYGDLIFHDGPDDEQPELARATREGKWGADFSIALPQIPDAGSSNGRETLRYKVGRRERYWFGMEVGEGANRHIERFEWRRSHGKDIKSVGQSSWGWKLVRIGGGTQKEADSGSDDEQTRKDGFTSDGKEIVAVWADAKSWKGVSKVGEFQLRGSGATGELGTQWALMAIVSYMCMWQKTMQSATSAGTAAAVS
ncbi:hypothetical protein FZEAL_6948 [Fusarium zealandicum]|uniref:Uncharacterized protein n=1 Tax=Fusarium zealandicum TaxID=1053134 RepID=A0A8H4UGX0_9HYPO|nr:hypothetical protein FZEAL_6948 [Fusarium zealandicum]